MNTPKVSKTRRQLVQALGAGSLLPAAAYSGVAHANLAAGDYPKQPIKMVVPYPPGGGTDIIARIVQQKVSEFLKQPVVIENKGGGGGSVGTQVAARAANDGYTVLFTLSSHTINQAIYPKLPYDVITDFEPVAMVASLPQILVANKDFPVNNVAELIAAAKKQPGKLAFASVGNGSPGHLAGEMMMIKAGIDMIHVPYRGGGPAITDVMGGQVPFLWVSIPAAANFVKQGKLKALAVSTLKRSPAFPDVPTMKDAGMTDFEVDSWYAAFLPAKTPKPIVEKLNKAFNYALSQPEVKEKLLAQGSEGVGGAPAVLASVIPKELIKWTKLVRQANIKPD